MSLYRPRAGRFDWLDIYLPTLQGDWNFPNPKIILSSGSIFICAPGITGVT